MDAVLVADHGELNPLMTSPPLPVSNALSVLGLMEALRNRTDPSAKQALKPCDSGWKPQKRNDGGLTFDDAMWFARWHTAIGAIVAAIAWTVSPALFAWMSPVILALVLAGPVSWLTSRRAGPIERWALATNEDRMPPAVLIDAGHRGRDWARRIATPGGLSQQPDAAAA